jgi:hypothetical protein
MKDFLKSFCYGCAFAVGFFAAISFTADAEDMTAEAEQAEYAAFLEGAAYGAREATLNKQCGWRDQYRSVM